MQALTRDVRHPRALGASAFAALAIAVVISLAPTPGDRDADARPHARAASPGPAATPAPAPDATISVRSLQVGRRARGFVGVSIEYSALSHYTGLDPTAVNPVFEQLLRNLSPGQTPQVRSAATAATRPGGPSRAWPGHWASTTRSPGAGWPWRASWPPTPAPASHSAWTSSGQPAARRGRGSRAVRGRDQARRRAGDRHRAEALCVVPWYRNPEGRLVYVRPRNYGFAAFSRDFARAVQVMPAHTALAGPTFSGRTWLSDLGRFIAQEPRVQEITDHAYPLNRCSTSPATPSTQPCRGC